MNNENTIKEILEEIEKIHKKILLLESRLKFYEHMLTTKKGE